MKTDRALAAGNSRRGRNKTGRQPWRIVQDWLLFLLWPLQAAWWLAGQLLAIGRGALRLGIRCCLGLYGLWLLGQLCYGLGYVLLYPWLTH